MTGSGEIRNYRDLKREILRLEELAAHHKLMLDNEVESVKNSFSIFSYGFGIIKGLFAWKAGPVGKTISSFVKDWLKKK